MYVDALRLVALDRLRVELVVVHVDAEELAVAVERRATPVSQRRGHRSPPGSTLTDCTTRCVGKISSPGERDETSTANVCVADGLLLAERDGRLVAVVAVGDQQRHVELELAASRAARRCVRTPPSSTSISGSPVGHGDGRVGVVEQEDRLELRARRAQQAQPVLLRPPRA